MTDSIKELKHKRLQFLFHLYETTEGQQQVFANMWELGKELGLSKDETGRIVDYLSKEHLLKHISVDGGIAIEHAGVVMVENSYAELEDMRKHVPQQQKAIQKHGTKETRVSHQATIVKILFLATNPTDTARLRLDEESRAIDQVLRQAEFRDRFDVEQHWAIRVTDIQGYLLRHKPDIVHFSGHGGQSSEIIMEDSSGESHPVSARALSTLFSVLKGNIRCVVLNACYSERQAKAIAEHIDCVIGMSKSIKDVSAVSFATAFYQALAYGQNVKAAFDLGCIQIDLENLSEQDRPKLIASRKNPEEMVFVNQKKDNH